LFGGTGETIDLAVFSAASIEKPNSLDIL